MELSDLTGLFGASYVTTNKELLSFFVERWYTDTNTSAVYRGVDHHIG